MKLFRCRSGVFTGLLTVLLTVLLAGWFAGCTPSAPPVEPVASLKAVTLDSTVRMLAGQTVYVPIYSQIYTWERSRTIDLTATLSIRNTDADRPIILSAVRYYDSDGKLVRDHLEQPVELGSLASTNFLVNQEDRSGGAGAAFVVEWQSPAEVSAPVIEAVMINTSGNQGISFISPGRVIKSFN